MYRKLSLIAIIFILFYFESANCQSVIDKLKLELNKCSHDTLKIPILDRLCLSLTLVDVNQAFNYGNLSLKLRNTNKYYRNIDSSYYNIAICYRLTNNFLLAVGFGLKALNECEKTDNQVFNIDILYEVSNIYLAMKQFDLSMIYSQKAIAICNQLNDKKHKGKLLNNMGSIYHQSARYDSAEAYYQLALKLRKEINDKKGISAVLNNLGLLYSGLNQHQKALDCQMNALDIKKELSDTVGIYLHSFSSIGILYGQMKHYDDAIKYLKLSILGTKRLGFEAVNIDSYKYLSNVYYQMGDYKNSADYRNLYSQIKDSIFTDKLNTQIAQLQTRYESEKKESEIKLLNSENKSKKAFIQRQKAIGLAIIGGFISTIILAFILFNARRKQKRINEILHTQNNKIIQQNAELQELNATKDKFFNIIAHDLRNPFYSIIGLSDLIISDLSTNSQEQTADYVKFIRSSAHGAYKLLENLLDWARTQTGKIEFKPEIFVLNNLFIDIIEITASNSLAKNIQISYEIDENTEMYADKNMINTTLRNLVTNAIKYTNNSGTIKLIAVKIEHHIQISVLDNGVGLAANKISKLFKISEHISTPGTENEQGTGLGLLLCKEFVEKHGGKIWVESEVGEGSCFHFTIPK